eukprot:6790383-Prymnesium_polylepis.1
MYMVPKRYDLFAFFDYKSYWSLNPGALKKEERRREMKYSICSTFLVPDDPIVTEQKKKKAKGAGAGAGA